MSEKTESVEVITDCSDCGNEMHMLCDGIDDDHNGIMPCRLWQLDYEVHADSVPQSRWNRKRVELSGRRMLE